MPCNTKTVASGKSCDRCKIPPLAKIPPSNIATSTVTVNIEGESDIDAIDDEITVFGEWVNVTLEK